MASSIAATTTTASGAASSVSKTTHAVSSYLPLSHRHSLSRVAFRLSPRPKLQFSIKGPQYSWNLSKGVKAQLNEVAVDGPAHDAVPAVEARDSMPSIKLSPEALASEESVSEFISQVASLVKLVDSRDIVELQLKQLDCELLIRKKEALPQPTSSAPVYMMHSPPPPAFQAPPSVAAAAPSAAAPSAAAPSAAAPSAPAPSTPTPLPSKPATKSAKSSLPPFKCPMAGTFYRSPAPSAPPFVKVGDKVQKGQVVCIIEAMKLMNEIEADQSGTIVEILAEDGKPVSIGLPLMVIQP